MGKRELISNGSANDRLNVHRILCIDYGIDCARLLEELSASRNAETVAPRLALYNSLIRGINTQEGDLRLAPSYESTDNVGESTLDYLDTLTQQLQRSTRSDEPLHELIFSGSGVKRVAFTPRIGRR